jgi:hypothetical protein
MARLSQDAGRLAASDWVCDRAVTSKEIVVAASGEIDTFESVAMPVTMKGG